MEYHGEQLNNLVQKLVTLPTETEWIEFKTTYVENTKIGEYISAIGNATTLSGRSFGYVVWGIDNTSHEIVGTTFDYRKTKEGAEELEAWLAHMCSPRVNFRFYQTEIDGKRVVLLQIPGATESPIVFAGQKWIRVGSNNKKLDQYPDKEKALWLSMVRTPVELRSVMEGLNEEEILQHLNYEAYCDILNKPRATTIDDIIDELKNEKFIVQGDSLTWDITNLGALMIGKNIQNFNGLSHKVLRVIVYDGADRAYSKQEEEFTQGYALSYEQVIRHIETVIPRREVIVDGIKKQQLSFPDIAIRELVANMIVHQDINHHGTYPTVEVFSDRIEFYNAGAPLVSVERIIDFVPKARNENMTSFMRRCNICDERGSGYDKIVRATSSNAMLAPSVENQENQFTKVTLFSKIPFSIISKKEKVWTCYMQACLDYVGKRTITNSEIRKIFGLEEKDGYKASRVLRDTVAEGLICPLDENTAPRHMQYIPFWGKKG